MKRNFSWIFITNVCLVVLMILPAVAYCQIGDPAGDPDAPIDGGVSILVAAGIGYGIKKARDRKRKHAE